MATTVKNFTAGNKAWRVFKDRSHLPYKKEEVEVTKVGRKYVYCGAYAQYEALENTQAEYLVNRAAFCFEDFLFPTEESADVFINTKKMRETIRAMLDLNRIDKVPSWKIELIHKILMAESEDSFKLK